MIRKKLRKLTALLFMIFSSVSKNTVIKHLIVRMLLGDIWCDVKEPSRIYLKYSEIYPVSGMISG